MSSDIEIMTEVAVPEVVEKAATSQDYDKTLDAMEEARKSGAIVSGMVVDAVRGGLVVDLGVRGFVPKSQIATRNMSNLERYVGQTIEGKVLEVNREKGSVVLSERVLAEERRKVEREETLSKLQEGQTVEGTVRRLADFGAFVDIGGVDGLLHVSDMAWEHVGHPSEIVNVGDTLTVKVLRIDKGGDRISLGLKQFQEDPWQSARRTHREDDLLEVTITEVTSAGAVVQIMKGVEGFIPEREYPSKKPGESADPDAVPAVIEVGSTVTAKIIEMRQRERKMVLSIKQAERDRERRDVREYMKRQQKEVATPTLGDLFGDVLGKFKTDDE